jgi:hypothetical protein
LGFILQPNLRGKNLSVNQLPGSRSRDRVFILSPNFRKV